MTANKHKMVAGSLQRYSAHVAREYQTASAELLRLSTVFLLCTKLREFVNDSNAALIDSETQPERLGLFISNNKPECLELDTHQHPVHDYRLPLILEFVQNKLRTDSPQLFKIFFVMFLTGYKKTVGECAASLGLLPHEIESLLIEVLKRVRIAVNYTLQNPTFRKNYQKLFERGEPQCL